MSALEWGGIFAFLAVSALVLCEDFRRSRIPNKILAAGFGICAVIFFARAAQTVLANRHFPAWIGPSLIGRFYLDFAATVAVAIASALALWFMNFWPAGDAKLFILTATFLPLISPSLASSPLMFSLSLLGNAFIPAASIFIILAITDEGRTMIDRGVGSYCSDLLRQLIQAGRMVFAQRRQHYAAAFNLGGLFFLLALLSDYSPSRLFQQALSPAAASILILVWWRGMSKLLSRYTVLIWAICGIFVIGLAAHPALLWAKIIGAFKTLAGFGIFFGLGRKILRDYFARKESAFTNIDSLKEGDIPAPAVLQKLRAVSTVKRRFKTVYPDGLTADQVEALRSAARSLPEEFGRGVFLIRSTPFAFWILLGAWGLLAKINCLSIIRGLL